MRRPLKLLRCLGPLSAGLALATAPVVAQATPGTVVFAIPGEPRPLPYFGGRNTHDADVADQLFLRIAGLGPSLRTSGDAAMQPQLASGWRRVDSVTVDFTIDPRARWHDGRPVTSRDVTFTWQLIHAPALGVSLAPFALIDTIVAIDAGHFRVRFTQPSGEQVYTVGFQLTPLPAHLLAGIAAESLSTSAFARAPVGNGPFRFVRQVPGQLYELRAVPAFFLGRPGITRLLFRVIPDGTARFNALLSGEVDVLDNLAAQQVPAVQQRRGMRLLTLPNTLVLYALMNSRARGDASAPHPILADVRVREAIAQALDRRVLATSAYGASTLAPEAVRSQLWGWLGPIPPPPGADLAAARRLLADAGWRDADGDGVLDRNGTPLELHVTYPGPSAVRSGLAVQIERMLAAAGIKAILEPFEGPVWIAKRNAGDFDIDLSGVDQDPSPLSLVQSWSCAESEAKGTSNVGRWCDPEFDRLLRAASRMPDPASGYRQALARMAAWRPAVTLAAPIRIVAIHPRYENTLVHGAHPWTDLWRWRVSQGAGLPRDR